MHSPQLQSEPKPIEVKVIQDLSATPLLNHSAVSIGNFDGVHLGHRKLIAELCKQASLNGISPAVATFDPHPVEVLNPGLKLPKLNSLSRKAELLGSCGVEHLIVFPTDPALLELSYEEFFRQYVLKKLNAKVLVEGPNFFFGKDRRGSIKELRQLCSQNSVQLQIVEIASEGQKIISSSVIRRHLESGEIELANRLLSSRFQLEGIVRPGAARGRKLGFPTANLEEIKCLIPKDGVYSGLAHFNNQRAVCAINVGNNPTFEDQRRKVEVHLVDENVDLYGRVLQVEFLSRLRDLTKFNSKEELVTQIGLDIETIRQKTLDFI